VKDHCYGGGGVPFSGGGVAVAVGNWIGIDWSVWSYGSFVYRSLVLLG
jgi:hypothetical protein